MKQASKVCFKFRPSILRLDARQISRFFFLFSLLTKYLENKWTNSVSLLCFYSILTEEIRQGVIALRKWEKNRNIFFSQLTFWASFNHRMCNDFLIPSRCFRRKPEHVLSRKCHLRVRRRHIIIYFSARETQCCTLQVFIPFGRLVFEKKCNLHWNHLQIKISQQLWS